jgi:Protein of unknown function (DUF2802)
MDFTEFGWREAWMLAVVAAVVYLAALLIRLIMLRRRRRATAPAAPDTQIPPVLSVVEAPQAVEASPSAFAEHLAWTRLDGEVKELRAELATVRNELAAARNELVGVQAELSESKVARRVSPLYADAVALARRGFDARGIAEECGISVAEAELVLSMSGGGQNLDDEVNDGGNGSVEPAGRR